ncbi:porin [Marinomonas mediterranea]|jgi:hypothetical protein|uniref:Porin domain-containing protein n=1 Tax=Marinomonas mediterranea (strain ATCC 700492 / JCM 21426 / NBRC 103028 / MMB-1) TaxID=717774 RepID=F2JWE6_MARM1|nr:porin [Marinomonas mediterranea]ADZ90619.1 hypothetical protein Marme_1346 [Marinomonas mediterranea MMB-1]WCN08661.1 hypothetical protein GV055_06815 [Marinomonas mediterranea]WCN12716.1 hypothetical protein GV054_06655 [Marinomonas mediterranea]WCN16789.1 hypothetical protein GV053_06795 [Marinomonas mediterranea MMB-1]
MKAIKLASVFAVSAVAAAVSTTTFAAEPVFSGEAGIEYTSYASDAKKGDSLDGTDVGEVEFSVDTGVVYAEVEIATSGADEGTTIGMEKLYVKQGDVKFGRFDGTVATKAFMGMDEIGFSGVDLNTDQGTKGDTDNTGVRYSVTPELTVSLEATEAAGKEDSQIGFAAAYVADMGDFEVGVSAGSIDDATAVNLGAKTSMDAVTLAVNYGMGDRGVKGIEEASEYGFSVAFAASDALTLTLQYANQTTNAGTAGAKDKETDGTYFVAEYVSGDLTYSFENYNGDIGTEKNVLGVTASF